MEEAERGVPGAGEEVVGVSADGVCGAGEGVEAAGDFRTHSNHPPARPLEMQAARIAARPTRGSWLCVSAVLEEEEGEESSWTMATPAVRRKSENHLVRVRERWKKRREKSAVVRSLSYRLISTAISGWSQ